MNHIISNIGIFTTHCRNSSNPLIKSLIQFHGKVISSFDRLPSEGKVLEIAKRIAIIVISPLAYLALGLFVLAGLAFNSGSAITTAQKIPIASHPKHLIPVTLKCNEIKQDCLSTIKSVKTISQLQSIKIFTDIKCDQKKFSEDCVIKKSDLSILDEDFVSQEIDTLFNHAKDFLEVQDTNKLSFKWIALLKAKDGTFHEAHDKGKYFYDQGNYYSTINPGVAKNIDPNHLQKYFSLALKTMGRKNTPQLNSQLDFI